MATIDIGMYEPRSERISVRASHGDNLLIARSKLQERIETNYDRNGMRFMASAVNARGYGGEGSEATVTINNPIVIDRTETGAPDLDSVTFTPRAVAGILRRHPNIHNANTEAAAPNPLRGHVPQFEDSEGRLDDWQIDEWTTMMAGQATWDLPLMQSLFQSHQGELRAAIREVTGHDGLVVRAKGFHTRDVFAWSADQIADITRPDPAYLDTPYPYPAAEWAKQIAEREPTAWDLLDHGKPWHLQPRDSYPTDEQGQAVSRFGEATPNLLISQEEADRRAGRFAEQATRALTAMGYPPRFGVRPLWLMDTQTGPVPEIPANQPIMDKAMDLAHVIGAIHVATGRLEANQDKPNAEQIEQAMGVGHIVGDKLLETYGLVQVHDPDPWMIEKTETAARELRDNLLDPIAETMTPDPWTPTNSAPGHETGTATQATPANRTDTILAADPWKPAAATGTGQPGLPKPGVMQTPDTARGGIQGPAIGL